MLQHPLLPFGVATVAEYCATILDAAAAAHGRAVFAVPGGRSPGPIISELAGMIDSFLRQRLHLIWVDERAVPKNHSDRNDAAILAAWDAGGPRPLGVHPMPAEADDLEAAAEAYCATLRQLKADQGPDLTLLGIGEDGHFASCFPAHAGLGELGPVFAVYDSPKPPPRRLSLALPVIAGSTHLVVLALGHDKGLRIREALRAEDCNNPVSLLPGSRCRVFCDDAALAAAVT
ncbi:MAG: 6-phosphogluconolactonase [Planctomycetota bacterium]|nr:MAG: 6-phosphogluconolactonase [Planctomycetota bacterium]